MGKNKIKNSIRAHRLKLNLTQEDIAKAIGLQTADRISRWENGLTFPHTKNLLKISKVLMVDPQDLYSSEESK